MKYAAIFILAGLLAPGLALAAEPPDYLREIKPILAQKCYACHGALKQQSGLRLDTAALARQGGDSGPALAAGKATESLIVKKVTAENRDERMPPPGEGEPLDAKQIALLTAWINSGAKAPDEPTPLDPRKHWAFQPPIAVAPPEVKNATWVRNPIDAFLAAGHERQGLQAAPPAEKHVLLRRVYLDLIGLPPTRDELRAFLANPSDAAYEQVVDRLLAMQYGERWGRHWMDIWRYSDWAGYKQEIRNSQRHIWHWRDWIVESLNADQGYDRMVVEMLAGDELAPSDPSVLRATGYLARNWHNSNRNIWLDATVEHTAKAFLGLTLNCARCHDHKYDPLEQLAYYQFRALFESHDVRTDLLPGEADPLKDGLPHAYDGRLDAPTYVYLKGNEKQPDKEHPVAPNVPSLFGRKLKIQPIDLPQGAYYPALNESRERDAIAAAQAGLATSETALTKARSAREAASEGEQDATKGVLALAEAKFAAAQAALTSLQVRYVADRAKHASPPDERFSELAKAAAAAERQATMCSAQAECLQLEQTLAAARKVEKPDQKAKDALVKTEKDLAAAQKKLVDAEAALAKPGEKYTPVGTEYPRTSSGRRLALARWITERNNPLAARVAVNHVWLRHFGSPLVENVFDFGLRSPRPRHAELLDWLAVQFMENGWQMKQLHRWIVTSNAYRMASEVREADANLALDPDNHWLWRMNSRRLEAEAVRDSVLHVAGNLDLTLGGPDIDYQLGQTSPRRSIYFRHAYEKEMKFLELFDSANVNECYRRSESVIPQQALALANSPLGLAQSRRLARSLSAAASVSNATFIQSAFEQVLSRLPSSAELAECQKFLDDQTARLANSTNLTPVGNNVKPQLAPADDPALRARENLVHVLMNHNDFVMAY